MWYQQTLTLSAKPRGFHLVTDEVIGQIRDLSRVVKDIDGETLSPARAGRGLPSAGGGGRASIQVAPFV